MLRNLSFSLLNFIIKKSLSQSVVFDFMTPLLFSTFEVTTQAFYRASLSAAIVNLKPIIPGRKDFSDLEESYKFSTSYQMFLYFLLEPFRVSLILMVLF